MVSSFGSDYKEGSLRANAYGHHIISGSSFDTSHTSSFGSTNQTPAGMSAELLEDMSIIDDLYNEFGDSSEPDEIGKQRNESLHVVRPNTLLADTLFCVHSLSQRI
jgi:hypothetical protein